MLGKFFRLSGLWSRPGSEGEDFVLGPGGPRCGHDEMVDVRSLVRVGGAEAAEIEESGFGALL